VPLPDRVPKRSRGRMSESLFYPAAKDLVDSLAAVYATCPEILEQFKDTPARLARMYSEFCWDPDIIEEEIGKQFRVFDSNFDEMLVKKDVQIWTLCPHHLLPCEFRVYMGYIPDKGKVLGLSKLTRVATVLAKKPIMQEQYTTELANLFMDRLKPLGVGITVYGRHGCMMARGIRQNSEVVTSVMRGVFLKEGPTRSEFLAFCRDRG